MVNYKFHMSSVLCLLLLGLFLSSFKNIKPMSTQRTFVKEFWLSFVPPIEEFSEKQILMPCSLKKINFFEDSSLDEQALIENYYPVMDSVIVIPQRFRFNHE